MGVEEPNNIKRSLPDFTPDPKLSGGTMPFVREPGFTGTQKGQIGETLMDVARVGGQILARLEQRRQENEAKQRALDLATLQADLITSEEKQRREFYGSYDKSNITSIGKFSTAWDSKYREMQNNYLATVKDPETRRQAGILVENYRSKSFLAGLAMQDEMELTWFQNQYSGFMQSADEALRSSPTKDTMLSLQLSLSAMLQDIKGQTRDEKVAQRFDEQYDSLAGKLATNLIISQATTGKDPRTALQSLRDPEVNRFIGIEKQQDLEQYLDKLLHAHDSDLLKQAEKLKDNAIEAMILGKDPAPIAAELMKIDSLVSLPDDLVQEITLAESYIHRYDTLRQNMGSLSDLQFEEALASLSLENSDELPSNIDLTLMKSWDARAREVLTRQRDQMKRNPVAAEMAALGTDDPEEARKSLVSKQLSTGANALGINLLQPAEAQVIVNQISNAVASGNKSAAFQVFEQLRADFAADAAHQYRKVNDNYDWYDLVLEQLMRTSAKDPLSKRLVAAAILQQDGMELDQSNQFLMDAAFMKGDMRATLLRQAGYGEGPSAWKQLKADIAAASPEWQHYFRQIKGLNIHSSQALIEQEALVADAVLAAIAKGGYGDTGPSLPFIGPVGMLGGATGRTNAIRAVVDELLPYRLVSVQGFPTKPSPRRVQPLPGAPAVGVDGIFDWRVKVNASNLLVPREYLKDRTPQQVQQRVLTRVSQFLTDEATYRDLIPVANPYAPDTRNFPDKVWNTLRKVEGTGLVKNDGNGTPSKFGINFAHNQSALRAYGITKPDDMDKLTEAQAKEIFKTRYFAGTEAATVRDPRLALFVADTIFNGGWTDIRSKVPEYYRVKDLPRTPGNAAKLDAVYDKLEKVRAEWIRANKGFDPTNRLKQLRTDSLNLLPQGVSDTTLRAGQHALWERTRRYINSNVSLENAPDLSGAMLVVTENGRKVAVPGWHGKPIVLPWSYLLGDK